MRFHAALFVAVFALAACEPEQPAEQAQTPPPPPPAETPSAAPRAELESVPFSALPGWPDPQLAEALPAFRRSCAILLERPDEQPLGPPQAGRIADWRPICAELDTIGDQPAFQAFLERAFIPYIVHDGGEPYGLFTGYFEAELRGARRPDATYNVPIYRRPADLVTVELGAFREDLAGESIVGRVEDQRFVPYHQRGAIDDGVLTGRNLELLWLADPIDAFVLHVQGSGRVILPDGTVVRIGYAANNGHTYHSIGRELIDRGALTLSEASWQGIRRWVEDNPGEARDLLAANPRYVFFRVIEGEGPIGALGVPLTAGRSLAVDPRHVPLGVPVWLDTVMPNSDQPLQRLMLAQDKGGAITGVVRGDFFWGYGAPALAQAGKMKSRGRYFLLLPKSAAQGS